MTHEREQKEILRALHEALSRANEEAKMYLQVRAKPDADVLLLYRVFDPALHYLGSLIQEPCQNVNSDHHRTLFRQRLSELIADDL